MALSANVVELDYTSPKLMQLSTVGMQFGAFTALSNLSFDIHQGEILGVAGPNGAGKSTLLNVCTGGLTATDGAITFKNHDITRTSRHGCCHLGIGRTFQIPTVLSSLSIGENILAGTLFGNHRKMSSDVILSDILDLIGLTDQVDANAGQSDLLTRKRIMLGAALATGPELLFMDEPLGGLNQDEITSFCDLIDHVRRMLNLTLVIVEHKTRALAALSDRILILNFGEMVMIDKPEIVLNNDRVVEIYLGKKHSA